jgi:hypothetical protein
MTSLVGGAGTILQGNGSSADPTFTATPTLGINGTSTGTLAFATSTGGGASVIIQNLATTVAWNFNLPTSAGSPGQVLTSQGGSTTSMTWANAITGASYRAGSQTISNNTSSQAVSFSSTLGTTAYGLTVTMVNVTDTNPQYQPVIVTSISATGFTAKWNSPTDSANYVLHYHAILNN